ncbi:MAG: HAD family hydrolase [Candidatus Jordarchaeales archaeon]|nr:HAD family hydrolase [Candidatus Jordarchaeia archaeon]
MSGGLAELVLSKKAVVFDCDGTLVKQIIDYRSARRAVIDVLRRHGVPGELLSPDEGILTMLRRGVNFLSAKGERVDQMISDVDELVERFELEAASKTTPIPGALELLTLLRRLGFKLGLFTLNKRSAMMIVVKRFNLDQLMDVMASRDDVPAPKPDPRHLESVFSRLSVEAAEAVVVGDHPVDVDCAVRAGAVAIGVLSSGRRREELEGAGAKVVVNSVASILEALERAVSGSLRA